MLNILLISEMTPQAPCGVVTYYKKVMDQFASDPEVQIHLVTADDASPWTKKAAGILEKGIRLFPFMSKKIIMLADDLLYQLLIWSALKKFKGQKIDYLHAQEPRSAYYAKRFFRGRIPTILTCHFNDNPVEEDILSYSIEKLENKRFLTEKSKKQFSETDNLIFVSKYCFEKTKHLLNDDSRVFIIHNGVDFDSLHPKSSNNGRKKKLEIINTGHIEKRKNQKQLVLIAKELAQSGFTDFHITILGIGPKLQALKELIQKNDLEPYFSLPGWVNNVNDYLDKANLYIHTSSNDNCPYSVIESIARKTPVLGFKVGGLIEILDDKFLFELNDTKAISRFVLDNLDNLEEIAAVQYKAIEKEFSSQYQFQQLKQVYISGHLVG